MCRLPARLHGGVFYLSNQSQFTMGLFFIYSILLFYHGTPDPSDLIFSALRSSFIFLPCAAHAQTCEMYSSFSASTGICMCEYVGGVLKVPKSKCCSSVEEYLKTGCSGTLNPAKVARVRAPPLCNVYVRRYMPYMWIPMHMQASGETAQRSRCALSIT
jgi:hypothetical protein